MLGRSTMRELRLTGVSADGSYLILSDGQEQFALLADERLHAAIQGDRARLGQLEIKLENQLRPRDIQARVRAGESVESVAADATMPLEKIRRFAEPVLAEREHIAERARQSSMRRIAGEGAVRTLEAAAADYAASVGAQPDALGWDAWRADDGRWRVRCSWYVDGEESSALFSFDPSGRSVAPLDATGRYVAGEPRPEPEPEPTPVAAEEVAGPARLSVVRGAADDSEEEPAAEDPVAVEDGPEPETVPVGADTDNTRVAALVRTEDPTAAVGGQADAPAAQPAEGPARKSRRPGRYGRPERRRREPELWSDEAAGTADDAPTDRLRLSDIAQHVEVENDDTEEPDHLAPTAQEPPPPAKPRPSRSRRPSVPSWDEIMFGRRKND